jgi:hypothetical protein
MSMDIDDLLKCRQNKDTLLHHILPEKSTKGEPVLSEGGAAADTFISAGDCNSENDMVT